MRLYLAGPLFTAPEREWNSDLAEHLRFRGHVCLVPQEEEGPHDSASKIFQRDVSAMMSCEAIVANLDGTDADSGTCWELGFAHGRGMLRVGYCTDFRLMAGRVNPMMTQSVHSMIWPDQAGFKIGDNVTLGKQTLASLIHERLEFLSAERRTYNWADK